ncbi:MAG: trehalose-6-phosphate synthase [Planctomycetes bacterium]|nr:trehalose-6-phosphate synthase [Planctomycetota bacterium]
MTKTRNPFISKSLRFGLVIAAFSAIATGLVFWIQVEGEHHRGLQDLTRRAQLLGHRVAPMARLALDGDDARAASVIDDRFDGHSRLLGMALHRPDGKMIACGQGLAEISDSFTDSVKQGLASKLESTKIQHDGGGSTHVLVQPLIDEKGDLKGAVVVLHDALYLEERMTRGILSGLLWSVGIGLGMFFITTGLAWLVFERPLHKLAEWMRRLRFGNTPELPPRGLPVGRLADETVHLAASFRAARSKEREEAQEVVRSDKAWTRDRLRAHAIDALGGQPLVVVSNREPYMHQLRDGKPTLVRPASGLVTGLDPVLRATGGLWVAHGAGDADRQTTDASGCVPVPPSNPRYTLKRVWITKEEEQGYYYGFSNEGLWPLCHLTHERPVFRTGDWDQYVRANQRFAAAVLEEIGSEKAVVMVQDYQLALVPGMLKSARPDLRVGLFWHIPWPNAEAFRICPYRVELLQGMLGADLLGFHLQQHCNNFLDTVDRMVEAKLDWDRFSAEIKGHSTLVRPFPISVQRWSERGVASGELLAAEIALLRQQQQLGSCAIGVGVDRIDYTKGIAERLRAIERLFEKYPQHRGKFTFVQLGAPSRTHIPRYRDLVTELEELADAINWKFHADGWKPIHFLVDHHEGPMVYAFLKMASVCIVSSLHDGMNLVAKEFVAAKAESGDAESPESEEGVLVLSEFAGAARDLPEAIIINPYDTEEFADAIHQAIDMDPRERRQRMTRMRMRIEEFNIYRWAADFLTALSQSKGRLEPSAASEASHS